MSASIKQKLWQEFAVEFRIMEGYEPNKNFKWHKRYYSWYLLGRNFRKPDEKEAKDGKVK